MTEEFNKYLSYVRNLGFEDTPDYDYLRELFTQALKSTGEVEDGEYDWMKLNNGKGWENMKSHPSAVHQMHNTNPNHNSSTAVNIHGQTRQQKTHLPIDRLNDPLPKPGGARDSRGRNQRDSQGKYGHLDAAKRKSLGGEPAAPEGSMAVQHSQQNLTATRAAPVQSPTGAQQMRQQPEEKPSFAKKLMNILCCGGGNA